MTVDDGMVEVDWKRIWDWKPINWITKLVRRINLRLDEENDSSTRIISNQTNNPPVSCTDRVPQTQLPTS